MPANPTGPPTPKRYDLHYGDICDQTDEGGCAAEMEESTTGEYVRYSDVAAIIARHAPGAEGPAEALRDLMLLISNMANLYDLKAANWLMRQPAYRDALPFAAPPACESKGEGK